MKSIFLTGLVLLLSLTSTALAQESHEPLPLQLHENELDRLIRQILR